MKIPSNFHRKFAQFNQSKLEENLLNIPLKFSTKVPIEIGGNFS